MLNPTFRGPFDDEINLVHLFGPQRIGQACRAAKPVVHVVDRLSGVADLEGWSALENLASLDLWNNGFDDPDALKARLAGVLPACRVTAVPTPCHIAVPVG